MPLQPYQIQEQDKDMLTLSARLGVPFQKLKELNPSITSISQGQFINVPKPAPTPGSLAAPYGPPNGLPPTTYKDPTPGVPYGPPNGLPLPQLNFSTAPTAGFNNYNAPGVGGAQNKPVNPYTSPTGGSVITPLRLQLQSITDPSQLPKSISATDANYSGFTSSQMLQAGYSLQNGNWVLTGTPGGAGGSAPQTGNNWMTNPSLHMIVFNKNAKNKHSKFETNLKWAQNAWKRKKRAAKGIGVQTTEPGNAIRGDTPSTTLDLVLGT